MSSRPNQTWYRAINALYAEKYMEQVRIELNSRPELVAVLSVKLKSFIVWAGYQRLDFVSNLDQEVEDFINKSFNERQRLQRTDPKAWIRISNAVFTRDGFTCQYCGAIDGKLEADHIIPFCEGGSDQMDNLTTACRKCNRQKRHKSVEVFKKWLEDQKAKLI